MDNHKENFMKRIKTASILLTVICLILLGTTMVFAGAWTQEKGKSYHRLAISNYYADQEYDADGNTRSMEWNGDFRDINLNYYVEYGVMDKLTAIMSLYYKDLEREDDYYEYTGKGIGDADLGLRYNILNNNLGVFSVQGLVKISDLYDEDDALPLGNGQEDFELRMLYGRSLWPVIPGYVNLESAYRWRLEDPSDEFRCLVEVGSDLGKNFYTRAKLDIVLGIGNGDDSTDISGNPTSALDYDLAKLDLTLGYQITSTIGLEVAYVPAIWGEGTAKGTTWTLALTYQPKK